MEGTHDHEVGRANLGGGVPPSGPHGNGDSAPPSGLGGSFRANLGNVERNFQQNSGQEFTPLGQRRRSVGDVSLGGEFRPFVNPTNQSQASRPSPQPQIGQPPHVPIPIKPLPTPGQARQQVPPQQQQWLPPQQPVPSVPQAQPQGQAAQSQAQAQPKNDKPSFLGAATRTALRTIVSAVAIPTVVVPATVLLFTLSFITYTLAGEEILGGVWGALEDSTIVQNEVKGSKEDVKKLFNTMCETVCYCFLGIVGESVGESEEYDGSVDNEELDSLSGSEEVSGVPVHGKGGDPGKTPESERPRRFADTPVPNLGKLSEEDVAFLNRAKEEVKNYFKLLHQEDPVQLKSSIEDFEARLKNSTPKTPAEGFVKERETKILEKLKKLLEVKEESEKLTREKESPEATETELTEKWNKAYGEASSVIVGYRQELNRLSGNTDRSL